MDSSAQLRPMFDVPIRMRVRGASQPAYATLLHVAISGCRIFAAQLLERGTALSFEWRLSNGKLLDVPGVVAARYSPRSGGPGHEYAVALEALPIEESSALQEEAALLARSASARSYDTSLVDISQFLNYRVPDDITVSYRIDNPRVYGIARASDITGNAMRLRCSDGLRVDETLHLALKLPDAVLSAHKGSDDELVTVPMGTRQVPRKMLRRPFLEIQVSGRVVALVKDSKRRDAYEIEFTEVNALARQELARYIYASQLARLKK